MRRSPPAGARLRLTCPTFPIHERLLLSRRARKNEIIPSHDTHKNGIKTGRAAEEFCEFYALFTGVAQNPDGLFTRVFSLLVLIAGTVLAGGPPMIDILVLGIGLGSFALFAAYIAACERV
jgi:hypothetical protein